MSVRYEAQGKIGILTMDRPARHNALNEDQWHALDAAVAQVEAALPRALVITGAGDKAFCAGMDVNPDNPQVARLIRAVQRGDRGPVDTFLSGLRRIVDRLVALPIPLIAALNGLAFGGGAEIATRCDLRVAAPHATICFSEVRLGLMPDIGGGPALARLVGPSRAADLVLTARKVDAEEALRLGLVDRVSAPGGALAEAIELAQRIAANGPRAVRRALAVIRRCGELPMEQALAFELDQAIGLIASGECSHGLAAFMGRKEPDFPDIAG